MDLDEVFPCFFGYLTTAFDESHSSLGDFLNDFFFIKPIDGEFVEYVNAGEVLDFLALPRSILALCVETPT